MSISQQKGRSMQMQSVIFRLAEVCDIQNLVALVNRAYRGESSRKGWTTEADFLSGQRIDAAGIEETLGRSRSQILVAANNHADDQESNSILLGCVHIEMVDSDLCYLGMLTVNPIGQAKGMGSALLQRAEDMSRAQWRAQKIEMTVISRRLELISWYERRGYQVTGERRPFPYGDERFGLPQVDDLEFVVLSKDFKIGSSSS